MAKLLDVLKGGRDEKVKEQLVFLKKAAEDRLNLYEKELNEMFLNPDAVGKIQIIGNRAISIVKEYHVNANVGASNKIKEMIDAFFTGSRDGAKKGLEKIVGIGIDTFLGNTLTGEHEKEIFAVMLEYHTIIRIDLKFWRYNFSSSNIIGKVENAFCYILSKSVVDHTKITRDELIYFVSQISGGDTAKLKEFLDELKEIWAENEYAPVRSIETNYLKNLR